MFTCILFIRICLSLIFFSFFGIVYLVIVFNLFLLLTSFVFLLTTFYILIFNIHILPSLHKLIQSIHLLGGYFFNSVLNLYFLFAFHIIGSLFIIFVFILIIKARIGLLLLIENVGVYLIESFSFFLICKMDVVKITK